MNMCSLTVNCYTECRENCTNPSSLHLLSSSVTSRFLVSLAGGKINFLSGEGVQEDVLLPAHTDTGTLTSLENISHPENKVFVPDFFALLSMSLC